MPASTRRRSRCGSPGVALVALTVALASACRAAAAADRAAFLGRAGARTLLSESTRASRVPRTRRPGARRLGMQQEHSEGEAEEEGGEGKETPFFVEAADAVVSAPLTPTVFPQRRPKTYNLEKGQVGVRFINTSGDPDVCTAAYPGEILTKVAKRAGVKIATACNSGICGTCMTDLEDKNGKSYRPGFQVVRACVTPVTLVPGADEMVLDIYRNRSKSGKLNKKLTRDETGMKVEVETVVDAMKRFEEGWEDDFVPDYKSGGDATVKPKDFVKKNFGKALDPGSVKPSITYNAQKRMENKHMYDDLPESVERRQPPAGGRELEAKLDAARQIDIRQRLLKERRERVNFYLDLAYRPIASTADMMALTQEEVDSRSRFFNSNPDTWEEAYGEANLPEVYREVVETDGRHSEGTTEARMAVYRSARQVPRYRFFGDPPLKQQDDEYLRKQGDPLKRIEFEEAAELDRLQMVTGEVAQDKNGFVFRDARTGRAVVPHKAGKPGTVRAELRDRRLPTCVSCEGTGLQPCMQCRAMGISRGAKGLKDLICPRCGGQSKIPCVGCAGSGIGPGAKF
eukprot:jgi/Undpi1/2529/HiC_scaffold_13.g05908.m1